MNVFLRKLLFVCIGLFITYSFTQAQSQIIHDAEYYVLKAQNGERWAQEDLEIEKKIADLQKEHGAPPNIIHIMWDDMSVGAVGIPHLQKNRGISTPHLNKLGQEGIYFTRMITEPSCTPSRADAMTGRQSIRNGMFNVGFPYEYGGLAAEEVTIAEVMSQAGYATAFYGKSHLGDVEESYLHTQGFDEALWTPYNQVPSLYVRRGQQAALFPGSMHTDMYPEDPYTLDHDWQPDGFVWALEGKKGEKASEWGNTETDDDYYKIDRECVDRLKVFMSKNAKEKKPFFAMFWPMMQSFLGNQPGTPNQTVSGSIIQEGYKNVDNYVGEILAYLKEIGIDENTLVVVMADNGPMVHDGPQGMVEDIYRGGKGDYWEGAVRVPCMMRWPAAIEPNQIVGDMIHITDLYTTFANLGGAKEYIPTDRIIDGLDQTSLLLNGDTYSRRDYAFIYTGDFLAATVKGRFKRIWAGELPGLSGAAFIDLYNDPREVSPKMLPGFTTKGMFNAMVARHMLWKQEYPDRDQAHGMPFTGLENAKESTRKASQPRFKKSDLPFDPQQYLEFKFPYDPTLEQGWGSGK